MSPGREPGAEVVAAASAAWLWVPDDAVSVSTEDYLLVRFPDHFAESLVVLRTASAAPALIDEVLGRVAELRGLGDRSLTWWVKLDAPEGLEDALVRRGGVPDETIDVLARPLSATDPAAAESPEGVQLRWAVDTPTAWDGHRVDVDVFGGSLPPAERVRAQVAVDRAAVESGHGGTVVAYLDGAPVGSGGVSLVDGVARLWGGGVVSGARRRGVYAALLAERLGYGQRSGASLALVKGRIETSGPILRRAGFTAYGQERSYRLPLAD